MTPEHIASLQLWASGIAFVAMLAIVINNARTRK